MFIKKGMMPCEHITVTKIIADVLIEMNTPLLSITDDNLYCFAYTNILKDNIELLLSEYGGILERSILNG